MKNPPMSAAESRLFALLLFNECCERYVNDGHFGYYEYIDFLRSQSDTRHDNCYAKALRLIEAGA